MRVFKKCVLLLLVLALTVCPLASCSGELGLSGGDVVMRYGDQELTEEDYAYLMSFIKGYYEFMLISQYGSGFDLDSFLATEQGADFAKVLDDAVQESAKMLLVVEQLCAENGLEVTDADSIKDMETFLADITAHYGGEDQTAIALAKMGFNMSSVERYDRYNLLLTLLNDYRYGDKGMAKIPESEVRKEFEKNYVKAEGYLYNYYNSDGTAFKYDFASEYAYSQVEEYFLANNLIDYVAFEDEAKAKEAYDALSAGEKELKEFYDSCKQRSEGKFVTDRDLAESLREGLASTDVDGWYLSGDVSGLYYVIHRLPISADLLDETMEKTVRTAMVNDVAYEFFCENFVTVRHILYTNETKAKQVYEAILAGETTFADHEKDTTDSGGVQYTFTDNLQMTAAFQNAAMEMKVGEYRLVKSDYGWHLMTRVELDLTKFSSSTAISAMTRDKLLAEAEAALEAAKNGTAFTKPEDGAHYSYTEPEVLAIADFQKYQAMYDGFINNKAGDCFIAEIPGNGIFVLKLHQLTDFDLSKKYETIETSLVSASFYDYLRSFFDNVVVYDDVISRFNVIDTTVLDEIFYY